MLTIGHSTLEIEAFLRALKESGVETLVDVRRFPGSRRHPQFSQKSLFQSLEEAGIRGVWREGLGGRREAVPGSINTGWKNESFRGYADYMQTEDFERSLDELLAVPGDVAVMCAEAVPWRCHRSLIADALTARAVPVWHIMSAQSKNPHKMTSFAHVENGRVTYPGETLGLFDSAS